MQWQLQQYMFCVEIDVKIKCRNSAQAQFTQEVSHICTAIAMFNHYGRRRCKITKFTLIFLICFCFVYIGTKKKGRALPKRTRLRSTRPDPPRTELAPLNRTLRQCRASGGKMCVLVLFVRPQSRLCQTDSYPTCYQRGTNTRKTINIRSV